MEFTDHLIISLILLDIVLVAGWLWMDKKNQQHHPKEK